MDEYTKNLALVFIAVGAVGFFIIVRIWFPVEEEGHIGSRIVAYEESCDARGLFYLRDVNACVDVEGVLHEVIVTGEGR